MNIYVGNLNFKVNEDDLQRVFEEHGAVDSVKIISDKYSGRSKGFGFVTMENQEEAQRAIDELNGIEFEGREMVVNEAKPRRTDY
jgi:RNA recognition motif-containing protein